MGVRLSSALAAVAIAVLAAAQFASAQTGAFGFENPTYFPNSCKKAGQVAILFTDGPSDHTNKLSTALTGAGATLKQFSFLPVTTYLNDPVVSATLKNVANGGAVIGLRWTTNATLKSLSATQIAARLQSDCVQIQNIIGKAPKYIFLPQIDVDQASYNAVVAQGYVPLGYNLDSQDYNVNNVVDDAECTANITGTYKAKLTPGGAGSYIAVERDTVYCVSASGAGVVATVKDAGYTLVDIGTCLGDANPYRASCTSTGAAGAPASASSAAASATRAATSSVAPAATASVPAGAAAATTTASRSAGVRSVAGWTVSGLVAVVGAALSLA